MHLSFDAPSLIKSCRLQAHAQITRDCKYSVFLLSLCLPLGRVYPVYSGPYQPSWVVLTWVEQHHAKPPPSAHAGALYVHLSVSMCLWEGSLRERGGVWVGVDIKGVGVTGGASGFKGQSASIFCTDIQRSLPRVVSSFHLPSWVDWGSTPPSFDSTPSPPPPTNLAHPTSPTPTCCPDLILPFHPSSSINCWHTSLCASLANASIQSCKNIESNNTKKHTHCCHKPKVFTLGVRVCVRMTEKKRWAEGKGVYEVQSAPPSLPPLAAPQQIIPERAEISAAAAPFSAEWRVFWVRLQLGNNTVLSKDGAQWHRTGQTSSLILFYYFFSCSGIHFLFSFILKFIFTANVHVGIMVNIVTLIVITVFCKRGFIIMNIIIIIIKGKTVLCCKEDNIVLWLLK